MTAEAAPPRTRSPEGGRPVVDTTYGPVRGVDDGTVKVVAGGPLRRRPVGELRWRAPSRRSAGRSPPMPAGSGPVCPQPTDPKIPIDLGAPQGEDCLTLNVWAPPGTQPGDGKPVMVWVHGGAYILGSSASRSTTARALAAGGDVVVVTVNYRLGALASSICPRSAPTPTVRDQPRPARRAGRAGVGARQHRGIRRRPGPRHPVRRVRRRRASSRRCWPAPRLPDCSHAAIAQSSPATSSYDPEPRPRRRRACSSTCSASAATNSAGWPACRSTRSSTASKDGVRRGAGSHPGHGWRSPRSSTATSSPTTRCTLARKGLTHPVPLIIGTNKNEAALFRYMKSPLMPITPEAIKAMFAEIAAEQPGLQLPSRRQTSTAPTAGRGKANGMGVASDLGFRMPSIWFAEGHRAVAPVYLYRFDFATPMLRVLRLDAAHATELPFVWGNLVAGPQGSDVHSSAGCKAGKARFRADAGAVDQLRHARRARRLAGDPEWRPYGADDRATLVIDKQDSVVDDLDADVRAAWGDDVLSFRVDELRRTVPWRCRRGFAGRPAAADARSRAVRDPVLPAAADHRVDRGAQARARRGRARPARGAYQTPRRVGEHLDGPGVDRHHGAWKFLALLGLRRDLRLPRALASVRHRSGTRG